MGLKKRFHFLQAIAGHLFSFGNFRKREKGSMILCVKKEFALKFYHFQIRMASRFRVII